MRSLKTLCGKMVSAPDRRKLMRYLVSRKLTKRRSLAVVDMSAGAFCYEQNQPHRRQSIQQ
jgi:putative transposase